MGCWVYVTEFGANANNACYIENRDNSSPNAGISLRNDGTNSKFEALLDYGSGVFQATTGTINTHQWYHILTTIDRDGNMVLYVNGVADATTNISAQSSVNLTHSTTAKIGQKIGGGSEIMGYVCNAGYWNRVLTQAEIKSIMFKQYADLSTSEKTSLVSFWNLDEVYSSSDGDTNIVFDDYHNGGESLGSEMAIDGNFDNNGASWTTDANFATTVTISNNAVTMTNNGTTGFGSVQQGAPSDGSGVEVDFIDGTWYKLTFDVTAITTSNVIVVYNYNSNLTKTLEGTSAPITVTDYFLASNTDGIDIRAVLKNGESITIDNISVKKVNGNPGELK